jgi:hypothetical protein
MGAKNNLRCWQRNGWLMGKRTLGLDYEIQKIALASDSAGGDGFCADPFTGKQHAIVPGCQQFP